MYDYDPPEPTQEEIEDHEAANAAASAPIRIEGVTLGMIRTTIVGILEGSYALGRRIDEVIEREVKKRVSSLFEGAVKERVELAVQAAIEEGFPTFDPYTGKEKSRTSIKEMVAKQMETKHGDYNSKGTLAELSVQNAVRKLFEGELNGELAKLQKDFKAQADAVFKAKIVQSLKQTLGVD